MSKHQYQELDSSCLKKMRKIFVEYEKFMTVQTEMGIYYMSFPHYLGREQNDNLFAAAVDTAHGCRIYLDGLEMLLQELTSNKLYSYWDAKTKSLILHQVSTTLLADLKVLIKTAWNRAHILILDANNSEKDRCVA